jgi:hypothetical protein
MTSDIDLAAVGCAVGASLLFTVANNLQRGAASAVPLEAGGPVVTAADPLTAFVVGRAMLGERLQGGVGSCLAVGTWLAAMAVGIVMTTRQTSGSDLTASQQRERLTWRARERRRFGCCLRVPLGLPRKPPDRRAVPERFSVILVQPPRTTTAC